MVGSSDVATGESNLRVGVGAPAEIVLNLLELKPAS